MALHPPRFSKTLPLRLVCHTTASLLALLLASSAIGQAPAPSAPSSAAPPPPAAQAPQAQPPAIRITTHLVQVNVVVQDKKGNPVTDLTKDDFTLLDGNKPQQISVFSMQATHLTPGIGGPPPKNTFTNRFEQQAGVPTTVTVVLFDALNTHFQDLAYARLQLLKFIAQLHPEDRVAIFGLAYNLYVLQDFTNDQQALISAVKKSMTPETAHANATDVQPSDTGNHAFDQFMDSMTQMESDFYNRDRALRTAKALTAIANHIGRLPGRKNLIWVSSAFPLTLNMDTMTPVEVTSLPSAPPDRETFKDQIDAAARALNDANVAVYPVDARGLNPPPKGAPPQGDFDTMNEIADRTGGRAFYNTNDIAGSVREAIDDSRVTYVLGYYPDHGEWNGKFREIKIKVNRPGVEVRYRRGYFAVTDAPATPRQLHVLLQDALSSPIDSTTIGMTVQATPAGATGAQTMKVHIQMDSLAIVLVPEADHWNGTLDLLMVQFDDKGKVLKAEVRTSEFRVTQATRETWDKSGYRIDLDMPLVPGADRVRFVACDEQSGATGSVTIPLKSLSHTSH